MLKLLVTVFSILVHDGYSQQLIGNPCTLEPSNSPGICKLLTKCQKIRDEVVFSQKLPQTCGFEGTQAIVCCPFRKQGDISKRKCTEYASHIQNKFDCPHLIVKRIAGGEPAGRVEFPHMALVGFEQDSGPIRWLCGGSIISEQYILTTAHCFVSRKEGEAKLVLLGVTNLNDTNHRQEIKIAERTPHPEFHRNSYYHDIGLLKLEKPIQINSYVRPACLYTNSQIPVTEVLAAGWDVPVCDWERCLTRIDNLQKVKLNILDTQSCNSTYYSRYSDWLSKGIIIVMHLCTGKRRENDCQGDTGGPLQIRHTSDDDAACMYDIVGVTSFARGCAFSKFLSTRVSYYIKWIEDIVWPESTE